MSNRVRLDPHTQSPAVQQVASGVPAQPAGVITMSELRRWNDIIDQPEHAAAHDVAEERQRLHNVSKAREGTWKNTVEATRKAKQNRRSEMLAQDEQRRALIDEEEAAYRKAHREQFLDDVTQKMYQRDQRVKQMNSQLLLNQVMQEREEQKVLSARRAQELKEREREFDLQVIQGALEDERRKKELLAAQREKNITEKNSVMRQLEEQKAQLKAQRALEAEEGRRLKAAAAAQAEEEARQKEMQKSMSRQVAIENLKTSAGSTTPRTPRERLQQRTAAKESDDAQLMSFVQMKQAQQAQVAAIGQAKRELTNRRIDNAAELLSLSPRAKKEQAVDLLSAHPSLTDKMSLQQSDRQMTQKAAKERYVENLAMESDLRAARKAKEKHSDEERMAAVLRNVATLAEYEEEEKRLQKEDALRLARIQQLQAKEKKVAEEMQIAEDREAKMMQDRLLKDEQEMFDSYINSMLPQQMSPALAKKALTQANKMMPS